MRILLLALASALALAGCFDGGGDPKGAGAGGGPDGEGPKLVATPTTGVIRAVVIDDAIRPVAGARVAVQVGEVVREAVTGGDGFAGFEGIQPGAYVVEAGKVGFEPARTTVVVEAGVDDPPVTKLQLIFVPGAAPFVVERSFEGFMQCATGAAGNSANLCFIANYYPCFAQQTAGQACMGNTTSDRSFYRVPFFTEYGRAPDWTQVELVWESTQTVSDELQLRVNVDEGETPIDYARTGSGTSPVVVTINGTQATEWELGTARSVQLEVFTASSVGGDPVGLAANQQIRYFVHAFYGYVPPEGWRFSDGNGVPSPSA